MSEVDAILALESVQYDQTTASRRRALIALFDAAALGELDGLEGTLVQITQSPFHVAERWQDARGFADRATRAGEVLEWLKPGPNPLEWHEIAADNRAVSTTLGALGVEVSARLLYHAYVLTAANMHVILGAKLPDFPSLESFAQLATPPA